MKSKVLDSATLKSRVWAGIWNLAAWGHETRGAIESAILNGEDIASRLPPPDDYWTRTKLKGHPEPEPEGIRIETVRALQELVSTNNDALKRGPNGAGESLFCQGIAQALRASGWEVALEVPVPGGRVDIVANRGSEQWVIEAKLAASSREVSQALGQLLLYGYHRPGSSLFFASPTQVTGELAELLARYGVQVLAK